jgi:hypothetical protein
MTDKSQTHNPTSRTTLGFTSTATISISMRAYFSTYFLWAAEHFSKLAAEIEDSHEGRSRFSIEHRAYVMNSILSSVAFLEAAINELYQDAYDNHTSYIENIDKELISNLADIWKITEVNKGSAIKLLPKYQIALIIAGKEKFEEGKNPYQDASLVIDLRNFLTHYKPRTIGEDTNVKLTDKLRGKFQKCKMFEESGNPDFPDKILGKGCAEWSFKSVKNFADEFYKRMDIKPNYQAVDIEKLGGKK